MSLSSYELVGVSDPNMHIQVWPISTPAPTGRPPATSHTFSFGKNHLRPLTGTLSIDALIPVSIDSISLFRKSHQPRIWGLETGETGNRHFELEINFLMERIAWNT